MGAVIGGALGGLVLIIVIMVVVILTSRAIYKSFFVSAKYNEVRGVYVLCRCMHVHHVHIWNTFCLLISFYLLSTVVVMPQYENFNIMNITIS